MLALFEDADREVTGTRTDLEDHVGGAQVGLVDDSVRARSVRKVEEAAVREERTLERRC